MDREMREAVEQFVGAFEVVFDEDWSYSRDHMLGNMDRIIPGGETFLRNSQDPDGLNWGSRAALLGAYDRLLQAMQERGMKARRPVRDPWFRYSWDSQSSS
jgi:hypothetical protein